MASLSNYRARSDVRSFTDESAREHRWTASQCERVRGRHMRAAAHASVREYLLRPYILGISEDRDWFKPRNSARRRNRSDAHHTAQMARRASAAIVSNRNDARAYRNRIFLGRRHHIFVVETLQTLASSL